MTPKQKNLVLIVSGIIFLTGCQPMYSAGTASSSSSKRTFEQLAFQTNDDEYNGGVNPPTHDANGSIPAEGGGTGGSSTPPTNYSIYVDANASHQCNAGELDVVELNFRCARKPLLLTARDKSGEHVLKKIDSPQTYGGDVSALFTGHLPFTANSSEVDIFACIDGDNDGNCADEPLNDINQYLMNKYMFIRGLAAADCSQNAGLLLYHQRLTLSKRTDGSVQINENESNPAGAIAQEYLRNLDKWANGGGATTPPDTHVVTLVKYDAGVCPPPSTRTDGCFARDTKIAITANQTVPIDELHVGDQVMLADGRLSRIAKVTAGPEEHPMFVFTTLDGRRISVTEKHPLLTDEGIMMAKDIKIAHQLQMADGNFATILSIREQPYADKVFNIELEGHETADHLIVAEGFVSGELFIQNKIGGRIPYYLSAR